MEKYYAMIFVLIFIFMILSSPDEKKCYECDGQGGTINPDGLSSEECNKCKGLGII